MKLLITGLAPFIFVGCACKPQIEYREVLIPTPMVIEKCEEPKYITYEGDFNTKISIINKNSLIKNNYIKCLELKIKPFTKEK